MTYCYISLSNIVSVPLESIRKKN